MRWGVNVCVSIVCGVVVGRMDVCGDGGWVWVWVCGCDARMRWMYMNDYSENLFE